MFAARRLLTAQPVRTAAAPALRLCARGMSSGAPSTPTDEFSSTDHSFEKDRIVKHKGDPTKRNFMYLVLGSGQMLYASVARLTLLKFVTSMSASEDVLALASAEIDLGNLEEGTTMTVKWRGKPVFIRKRNEDEIHREEQVPLELLRDPEPDEERVIKPEYLVIVGVCTHLGCVPMSNAGEYHGWFCPCHGSHYDLSGRIRKGPAPLNMEVPPYKFIEDTKILVG